MSVPRSFRKWAKTPKILKLAYNDLDPSEITHVEGIFVTKPLRTILDLIQTGETSTEFIEQSIGEALKRGLVTIKQLQTQESSTPGLKEIVKQAHVFLLR